ncbi:MAG: hypothetical protein H8E42_13395 [Nitrospinae bacterium]|nr:hypothetical protein [Nitrospinota bacterium]MBL7019042.1 hypothetical protein [Nitrospinaceae bacterium]
MPSTPPVNMQQILQMGTHTEKLQHTLQTLPNVTAQQVDKERQQDDELKRSQVQDMDPSYLIEEANPKTRGKKRVRVRKKNQSSDDDSKPEPPLPEDPYRGQINIVA